jgi:hypothetical protein
MAGTYGCNFRLIRNVVKRDFAIIFYFIITIGYLGCGLGAKKIPVNS